jgi:hypothetical protein
LTPTAETLKDDVGLQGKSEKEFKKVLKTQNSHVCEFSVGGRKYHKK